MSRSVLAFAALLSLGLASPLAAQTQAPADTGSMAYPTPVPQGNSAASATAPGKDTGSAAYPAPAPAGNLKTTTTTGQTHPTDTGQMAYPAPLPQGSVAGSTMPK